MMLEYVADSAEFLSDHDLVRFWAADPGGSRWQITVSLEALEALSGDETVDRDDLLSTFDRLCDDVVALVNRKRERTQRIDAHQNMRIEAVDIERFPLRRPTHG